MNVFVASHEYAGNGAAVMLVALLRHWKQDKGWNIDAYVPLENEVPEQLVELGINAVPELTPTGYDFALVNTLVVPPLLEAISRQLPTILWVHEGESIVRNAGLLPSQWMSLLSLPRRIVFQGPWQSEGIFKSFLTDAQPNAIVCVPNGMPDLPTDLSPALVRRDKKRIVFVGGVYGRKRPQDLAEAVLALGRRDIECVFIGTTSALETLGPKASLLKDNQDLFPLLGEVSRKEALEYISTADVFCLPSGDESQPIAPLEAASLGIPCLLSALAPYRDTWRHGENCLLHPTGNVDLLAWNLRVVLEDNSVRRRLINSARETAKRFSMRVFENRFDSITPQGAT